MGTAHRFCYVQMVDKVWYDWQNANISNFWAYQGGSVQNLTSLQALADYPNGMPPSLYVRPTQCSPVLSGLITANMLVCLFVFRSSTQPCRQMVCSTT